VLSGRFFGRARTDDGERLAALSTAARPGWAWLAEWFGAARAADLLERPDDLRCLIDRDIAAIDELISAQLDAILHAPRMRRLEGSWRGLAWLIGMTDSSARIKIRLLNLAWGELCRDLERASDFDQSNLFRRIYEDEFGMPGGEPFGLMVVDHEVRHQPAAHAPTDDVSALAALAGLAAAAFCPMVLGASPALFEVDGFEDLAMTADPAAPFRAASHMRWRTLAPREDARFLCVALPRLLARLPWGDEAHCRFGFRYVEYAPDVASRVWMNAGYAFAACVLRAFANHAWPADVRGVQTDEEGGGIVTCLPTEPFATDPGHTFVRQAADVVLTDKQERDLVDAGLMPLSALPFGEEVAFSAVRSLQTPKRYTTDAATANARISSQINSMLCVGRFAHFLKVIGRDRVGSFQTADVIERRLQAWLANYVNSNLGGGRESRARYPLLAGRVSVTERPGKPGVFGCVIQLQPHFQLDDLSATFRLVTEIAAPGRTQ
jgi:type VI secretion system protein ImpD/type VI secretion system protein ImpC